MKQNKTSVKKKTVRKVRKAKHQPAKAASITQLDAQCNKLMKGENAATKATDVFHVYLAAIVSLGNTLAFILEALQKLKKTDDQKAFIRKKIIDVRGRWTSEEKTKIVDAATKATSKTQSEDSLGIKFSRKQNSVQRSALIAGQEVLAWTMVKWHRIISGLATGDQFVAYPAMDMKTTYIGMLTKAFKHCHTYKGKEITLAESQKDLYSNPDYADSKAASKAQSAAMIVARATIMLTTGNKAIAKAWGKFKSEQASDFAAKRKRATLVKAGKKHLAAAVKTYKVKGHKAVNILSAIASTADDIETVDASGGETNRIKQLTELAPDKVLADIAKGRSKSVAIRKALATLK